VRRSLTAVLAAAALLWGVPAPAGDPEVPEKYISVDEVKALIDLGKQLVLIDVRAREQFDELHIRGARSLPLRELPRRLGEVPRLDFVVLY
jgi:hypothetical protein